MESPTYIPGRVQRKRTKGYRLPPNTKSVCRPGRFGNPIRIIDVWPQARQLAASEGKRGPEQIRQVAQQLAVDLFAQLLTDPLIKPGNGFVVSEEVRQRFVWMRGNLALLKGKQLACFCALLTNDGKPNPCHADVLLLKVDTGLPHQNEEEAHR